MRKRLVAAHSVAAAGAVAMLTLSCLRRFGFG